MYVLSLIWILLPTALQAQSYHFGDEGFERINHSIEIAEAKRRAALTPAQRASEGLTMKRNHLAIMCKDIKGRVLLESTKVKTKINEANKTNYDSAIYEIEALSKLVRDCSFNVKELGWNESIFQTWKDQVYEIPLRYYKGQILIAIRFNKKIPKEYITKFVELSKLLGIANEETENTTAPWLKDVRRVELLELENYFNFKSQFVDVSQDDDLKKYRDRSLLYGKTEGEIAKIIEAWKKSGLIGVESEKKSCQPPLDIRKPILGAVRNQGESSWCAHFALADVLTYKLNQRISAADVAINFYDFPLIQALKDVSGWNDSVMKAGFEKEAFTRLKSAGGACLEINFKSEGLDYSNLKNALRDIHTIKKYDLVDDDPVCKNKYSPPFQALFPNLKNPYGVLKSSSNLRVIKNLADQACGKRIDISNLEAYYDLAITESGKKNAFKIIDEQLAKKNILSIEFDSKTLQASNPSLHVNTVVGRRFNQKKNRCEYLVRGTWGPDAADNDIEVESGNYWVPKWNLMRNLIGVTYLE
ncbi:MAG: hypothetical protein KA715_12375 [Xanthomonadaceae bacterium]|nr:hypothetical protein [Xanthomonadaceae bacterium]